MSSFIYKPSAGTPINSNHPLARGLVGAVPLNEGGGIPYMYGSQKVQSVTPLPAGVIWEQGPSGPCMVFDGANASFLNFGDYSSLNLTTSGSIFIRANANSFSTTGLTLFTKQNYNPGTSGYSMWVPAGGSGPAQGRPLLNLGTATVSANYECADLGPFVSRQWCSVGASWTSGIAPIVSQAGRNYYTAGATAPTVGTATGWNFFLGGNNVVAGNWLGQIDFCYIWNRQISVTEMQSLTVAPFQIYEPSSSRFYSFPSSVSSVVNYSMNMAMFA